PVRVPGTSQASSGPWNNGSCGQVFGPAKSRESHLRSGAGQAEPERLPKVAMPFTFSLWSLAMREEACRREMPSCGVLLASLKTYSLCISSASQISIPVGRNVERVHLDILMRFGSPES